MGIRERKKKEGVDMEGIYRGWRKKLSIEKQKKVLFLHKMGMNCIQIASKLHYEEDDVWEVIENGVLIENQIDKPVKCKECGGRIILLPCIRCQVVKGVA